jgi:hypothetical protein
LFIIFEGTFTSFFKDKKSKRCHKLQKSRNQGFSYYFCLMIEGAGSITLTDGSGSGFRRPKNIWDPDPDPDLQHWFKRSLYRTSVKRPRKLLRGPDQPPDPRDPPPGGAHGAPQPTQEVHRPSHPHGPRPCQNHQSGSLFFFFPQVHLYEKFYV